MENLREPTEHEPPGRVVKTAVASLRERRGDPRCLTACHEAGHAAMAYFYGFKIFHVSIIPDVTSRGRCRREKVSIGELSQPENRRQLQAEIQVLYAGHAAESLVTGRRHPHKWRHISKHGGGSDHAHAEMLAFIFLGGLPRNADPAQSAAYERVCRAYLDLQIAGAYRHVHSRYLRPMVVALAHELLRRGEVTGHEAQEAMAGALRLMPTDAQTGQSPACPRSPAD